MAHRWHLGKDQPSSIRERLRVRLNRNPQPSSAGIVVDRASRSRPLEWAQKSVATTAGGKKIEGRKRHLNLWTH
jgi:hypothetical protein